MDQPHNLEAEEALLACCLIDNASYDSISTIVNADDFYGTSNKIIFKAISKLCSSGQEFSELDLDELLKREGTDKEAGGLSTIMYIQGQASSSTQIGSYAKIIKEKSKLRQIIRTSRIAIESATENQDPDVIIADIERAVTATLDNNSATDPSIRVAAESLREDFKKMEEGTYDTFALPTRIKQLDDKLSAGGIANGEVMVVAAPTSCGKTCIALNVALQNGVTHSKPGLYFSFEMQAKSLAKRMIQTCSAVNLNQFQEGVLSAEKQRRVWDATERVENAPIYTEHYVRNIDELRSRARMYKRKHHIEWIVIDYLQLVPWNTKLKKHDGIAEVSHQIKLMAMELDLLGVFGACRTNPQSVRPSVSSPEQWAMARINSFLFALRNGKFRSGKHDQDLLPEDHPMSTKKNEKANHVYNSCLLYTSPSPRDGLLSRMPSSA